jgi:hypothetical protein
MLENNLGYRMLPQDVKFEHISVRELHRKISMSFISEVENQTALAKNEFYRSLSRSVVQKQYFPILSLEL